MRSIRTFILIIVGLCFLGGCIPSPSGNPTGDINLGENAKKSFSSVDNTIDVTSVEITNNQIIIRGKNLNLVKNAQLLGTSISESLLISGISATQIVAVARRAFTITVGSAIDLIFEKAQGQVSFPISFSLQDGSVTAVKLSSMGATDGQILKYNAGTSLWAPASLDGLTYQGTWNVSTNTPNLSESSPRKGYYYVVSVAGSNDLLDPGNTRAWTVGEWAIYNGSSWETIATSSNAVMSVNGKTGAAITLELKELTNVDPSLAPTTGQVLSWDGSKWISQTLNFLTSGGNSITNSDLADGAVTTAKIADGAVTTVKISDNAITGAKILDATITGADIATGANINASKLGTGIIDNTEFSFLDNATSNLQAQLNSLILGDGTRPMTGDFNMGGKDITNIKKVGGINLLTNTIVPMGTAPGETGQFKFSELASNGGNSVGLRAADSLSSDLMFTLPSNVGSTGQVLATDGTNGVLSWSNVSRSAIAAGTPSHVVINDGSGNLSSEAVLALSRGGTNNGSFTDGSLLFYNASGTKILDDNARLFWDQSNKRVGIGNATPQSVLDIRNNTTNVPEDSDLTKFSLLLSKSSSVANDSVGLGFRIDATLDNSVVPQAAITAERINTNQGNLHFLTANGTAGQLRTIMTVTNDVKVGVGTKVPLQTFDVNGDLSISNHVGKVTSGTRAMNLNFYSGSELIPAEVTTPVAKIAGIDRYTGGTFDGDLAFYTELGDTLTERMRLTSAGKVGIGTTSPTANGLHIVKPDTETAEIMATGSDQGGGIIFAGRSTLYGGGIAYDGDTNPDIVGGIDRVTYFRRDNGVDSDVFSYGFGSNNVQFNGYVGIGTNAPATKLTVSGTGAVANHSLEIINTDATDTTNSSEISFKRTAINATQTAAIGMDDTTRDFFISVNGADRLNIDEAGNVGIGTSTPTAKLHVENGIGIFNHKNTDDETAGIDQAHLEVGEVQDWGDEIGIKISLDGDAGVITSSPGTDDTYAGDFPIIVRTAGNVATDDITTKFSVDGQGNTIVAGILTQGCQSGWTAVRGGRICFSALQGANSILNVRSVCMGLSARICNYADYMTACGDGLTLHTNDDWLGDTASDDTHKITNQATCGGGNFDGSPTNSGSRAFRCCY